MADLKWIEDFIDLSKTGNFSTTAANRFVTQPALSRRIKQLEEWIGAPLFERRRKPIRLTSEGEAFMPAAEEMLAWMQRARDRAWATVPRSGAAPGADAARQPVYHSEATPDLPDPRAASRPMTSSPGERGSFGKGGTKALLIDDSPLSLAVMRRMVQKEGFTAVTVDGGEKAIQLLTTLQPAIILTDCEMPGMDGYAMAERVKALVAAGEAPAIPIVAITGSTDLASVGRCFESGMDDYLCKPVDPKDLQVVLHRWVCGSETVEAVEKERLHQYHADLFDEQGHTLVKSFCDDRRQDVQAVSIAVDETDMDKIQHSCSALKADAYMLGAYSFARACSQLSQAAIQLDVPMTMAKRGPFLAEFVRLERIDQTAGIAH
ncbi:MAG: hypothetical protein AcusKO_22460 [Acuticoccus sp.]